MYLKRFLASALSGVFLFATSGCAANAATDNRTATPGEVQPAQMTPDYLQQLVAPIALYPDELVGQVLAASTYPTQVVEADRWLQQNSTLQGAQLANAVNQESWDPSIKALTEFPSVLSNMDKNLSWTSALGDAYFNDQDNVMIAIQALRNRAQAAGTLKTTTQQNVTTQDQTIAIEPANPQTVYLPTYDPWIVYGAPVAAFPGYVAGPWVAGPIVAFDVGFPVFWGFGFDWGWGAWGCDWFARRVDFHHRHFVSRSPTFIHHGDHLHDGGRAGARPPVRGNGFGGQRAPSDHRADRGFVAPRAAPNGRPGVFHGVEHGGMAAQHFSRGQSSFAGASHGGGFAGGAPGGAMHGGFGGGHGGGGGHR